MGKAELETGFIDAPPGTHPPFITNTNNDPALTASPPEAVLPSNIIEIPLLLTEKERIVPFEPYAKSLQRDPSSTYQSKTLQKKAQQLALGTPIAAYKFGDTPLEKNSKGIEETSRLRETIPDFRITTSMIRGVREVYDIATDSIISAEGYSCTTHNGRNLFFIFPDDDHKLELMDEPIELNGAAKVIQRRQGLRATGSDGSSSKDSLKYPFNTNADHDDIIRTLLANWGRLHSYFYKEKNLAGRHLRRYGEVFLNDYKIIYQREKDMVESLSGCGVVDFFGEGPDWQGIEIEVGAPLPFKVHQSQGHNVGLHAVIEEANTEHNVPPINSFIGSFWKDADQDEWIIHFHALDELPYTQAA